MNDEIFTNLINGFNDIKIKNDTVYQDNIEGIEKTYKGSTVEFLSKDTIILEPFYTNLFQNLISNEAEKRYSNNFYKD